MKILNKIVSDKNQPYIDLAGNDIFLEKSIFEQIYTGEITPTQALPLEVLFSSFVSDKSVVPPQLFISDLKLVLTSSGELISFQVIIKGDDHVFALKDLIRFTGTGNDNLILPGFQIKLKEISFIPADQQMMMQGMTQEGKGEAGLKLAYKPFLEQDVDISFFCKSDEESCITLSRLTESMLPKSLSSLLPATENGGSQNKLLDNLLQSGLTALEMSVNTLDQDVSFFAKGTILGFKGEIAFSITTLLDQRMVSFHIYGDEKQNLKSIPDVLRDTLGLNIGKDIEKFLPKMKFALTNLTFDQMEEIFILKGVMAGGGDCDGKSGYHLESSLQVEWQDGVGLDFEMDASESPLTLSVLLNDLPFSLGGINNVILKKIGDTAFHSLGIHIDTVASSFKIEGLANLFGVLAISGSFYFSRQEGLKFNTTVYSEPLSLGEIIRLLGIDAGITQLPTFKVGLKELNFDQANKQFSIQGEVVAGKGRALLELDIHLLSGGVEISFNYKSEEDARLTVGDLIEHSLPESFKTLLPANEEGAAPPLLKNLMESGLTNLQFSLNTQDDDLSFFASGILLGMKGEVALSINKFVDKRLVSFHIYGDEQANLKSIPDVLRDTLGLSVPKTLEDSLPKMKFALTELSFDQMEERLRLTGVMAQGKVARNKKGYRVESSLEVQWKDGICIDVDLDASDAPIRIDALEEDLPFSLDGVKTLLPLPVVEKIGATEFYKFGVNLDTANKSLSVEGMANLFGELAVNTVFNYLQVNGKGVISLQASVYSDPTPLRNVPKLLGMQKICGPGVVKLIPDFSLGLKEVTLDQQKGLFAISGSIGIGKSSAETSLSISKHQEKAGAIIGFRFEGDAGNPPSLIDMLGAVIPNVKASDIKLPGNFNIILQTLNLTVDTVEKNLSGKIAGVFIIANVPIYLSAESKAAKDPWILEGHSEPGKKISLTQFSSEILTSISPGLSLPHGIPEINFENIDFSLNTKTKALSFKSEANVGTTIPIRDKDCSLHLGMDVQYGPQTAQKKLTGNFRGELSIGEMIFLAGYDLGESKLSLKIDEKHPLNFKEVGEFLLGKGLFDTLPEDLTNNLAGMEISIFESSIDFANKGISLDICAILNDIKLGSDDLLIKQASISLKLDISSTKKYLMIEVKGKGNIGAAILFEDCQFKFEYDQKDGKANWLLCGKFYAEILGHNMLLEAMYKDVSGTKSLALSAQKPFPAIELASVRFEIDEFKLAVEKKPNENPAWTLSTTFQLKTDADIFELREGTVALINTAEATGLQLSAEAIDLKIPALAHLPWFSLDGPLLKLMYIKKTKKWSCHGETGFTAHKVPDLLTRVFLVDNVFTECTINDAKAEFSLKWRDDKSKDALIKIPMPPDMNKFGNFYVGMNELTIDLMNGGSVTAKLKLGLPKGLNDIFQSEDSKPEDKLELFRVYDPDAEDPDKGLLGLDLTISGKNGLSCQLAQTPFLFFEFTENAAGKKIMDFDLKEYGRFTIDVPEFSFSPDGSFRASGGFDIIEDIKLPLAPLKYLLKQCGAREVADVLPNGIPIKGVTFYTKEEGFKSDAFFDLFLSDDAQEAFPDWLKEGFDAIDEIANRLPREFLRYGNIEIPDHFHFNIELTVDGSFKFQLSVKDPNGEDEAVPLRMLIPNYPSFSGIELYSIAVGELFGGAMLRIDVDMEMDTFDLPSLLSSLLIDYDALPHEAKTLLPDPRCFRNSVRARNLIIAIVYQAGVPIPIPLFYDEIGFSYAGLEGMEIESSFGFPKPQVDLQDLMLLFTELNAFFSKGKDIDIKKLEEEITLGNFIIGPNYVRLPKYVSVEEDNNEVGSLIGTEKGIVLSPIKLIGALLNTIKNGSINNLIQVVDVEQRVSELDLNIFRVLKLHFEYAFTTPYEFVDYAYKELSSLSQEQAREFIKVLPPKRTGVPAGKDDPYVYEPVTEDTQGLIIFLKGEMSIADTLIFESGFGLAATGDGFGMGLQFDGHMEDIFDVHIRGLIGIRKDGQFLLEGDSHLSILNHQLLSGRFHFNNDGFKIEAKAGDGPICLTGKLQGMFADEIFFLKGEAELTLFGLSAYGVAEFLFAKATKKELIKMKDLTPPTQELVKNSQDGLVVLNSIYLHGDFHIGNIVKLKTTFRSVQDTEHTGMELSIYGKLSELLELKLEGAALISKQQGMAVHGDAFMKILNREVISAQFDYVNNKLTFKGHLDLFPESPLMQITGDVAGALSDNQFQLEGKSNISLVNCKFAQSRMVITDTKFLFHSQLFNLQSILFLQKNDKGFTLYGTMSEIRFGNILTISKTDNAIPTTPYDLGGPSIYISTDPKAPGFRLNSKINVIGIESSTDIIFSQAGFKFEVAGKLFNIISGSLEVSGNNLSNLKHIYIKGTIAAGDFEASAIAFIGNTARDITRQLDAACNKLGNAKAYLTEQERKIRGLDKQISSCKNQIQVKKNQITSKKSWYSKSPWYKKTYRWIELGAYVVARGVEIAALYTKIGVLEGLKLAAIGALEIAKAALTVAQGTLKGISGINKVLANASRAVIKASGQFLTIHTASIETMLDSICGGTSIVNFDVTFLGKRRQLNNVRINLLCPQDSIKSLADAIMKG